ncbi:copper chaperone SCO1/SenC family protein [Caenibius tardaugens NBRC 16725]|uniref:Copper chaperone SCO1/SenC family protein n=1 Tax=Caenibius tardaugens NBRC 16725 TaxID=1219035 RepID=U2ZXW1_9SPHN|nr:SCO family protein [Caenibius tardaugens]GAD50229.1 copper chaperone SCO1/SenC family protein [Caenibius tardaugens NBRC 16725]
MTEPLSESGAQPEQHGLRKVSLFLWVFMVLLAVVAAGIAIRGTQDGTPKEYADSVGGPFALVTPDGARFTERNLAGKPYAMFFGFTRCPDVCPTTLARMAQLRKRMGDDGMKFAIVFVSVDPGHDTPADIGNYTALFDTPIIGLTGTTAQIDQIVKRWRAFYQKVPLEGGDYTIDHTAGVFLMDRNGRLQSILDHHENENAALAKLRRLVA